jgi:death-on-curing protein
MGEPFRQSVVYLTLADVIAIHNRLVELTTGGFAALRNEGLLEETLNRPRMAAYYEEADIVRQAALFAVGISQAQAFVDGNKRTAYGVAEVFLDLNGIELTGDPIERAQQLEHVATRSDSLEAATDRFEAWLRAQIKSREL